MKIGAFLAKFHEFGSRGIWDTIYPIYVVKSLILWQNKPFYCINWAHYISNTPGTKFMKFGLKYPNLHFKKYKTIKVEPTWDCLNLLLNPYTEFMLNKTAFRYLLILPKHQKPGLCNYPYIYRPHFHEFISN